MAIQTKTVEVQGVSGQVTAFASKRNASATGTTTTVVPVENGSTGVYVVSVNYDDASPSNEPIGKFAISIGTETGELGRSNVTFLSGVATYEIGDVDAAGIREAVGLSSANLDTQLGDIPTVAEFTARTLTAASYFDPTAQNVTLAQSFPANFADLSIEVTTGKVTTLNPAIGSGSAHTAADVAALILSTPANKLVTNASGQVESSNMRGTDNALLSSSYVVPANFASLGINASGHIDRVTVVDTTTENTDMFDGAGVVSDLANLISALTPGSGDPNGFIVNMFVEDAIGRPVVGCEVVITGSDLSESVAVVAYGTTREGGQIDFRLAEGVYYGWRSHPRYNFTDPQTITVDSEGEVSFS